MWVSYPYDTHMDAMWVWLTLRDLDPMLLLRVADKMDCNICASTVGGDPLYAG